MSTTDVLNEERAEMRERVKRKVRRRPSRFRRVLLISSIVYAALLVLVWFLEDFVGEWYGWTTALAYLPQWPFAMPWAIMALLAAVKGHNRSSYVNLASGAFLLFAILGFRWTFPPSGARDLRVMTCNIHGGQAGVDRIAAEIRRQNPDVVCLQEANPEPGGTDPRPALKRALAGYWVASSGDLWTASRFPLLTTTVRRPQTAGLWRPTLQTDFRVRGKRVSILNVHFSTALAGAPRTHIYQSEHWRAAGKARRVQATELVDRIQRLDGPVLFMGDFNLPPHGRVYREIAQEYADAFESAGRGFGTTYSASKPLLRIDHVFTRGLRPMRCFVPKVSISDHRPVVADLAF